MSARLEIYRVKRLARGGDWFQFAVRALDKEGRVLLNLYAFRYDREARFIMPVMNGPFTIAVVDQQQPFIEALERLLTKADDWEDRDAFLHGAKEPVILE